MKAKPWSDMTDDERAAWVDASRLIEILKRNSRRSLEVPSNFNGEK